MKINIRFVFNKVWGFVEFIVMPTLAIIICLLLFLDIFLY